MIHHQIIPYFKGMQFFPVTHKNIQKFINRLNDNGRSYFYPKSISESQQHLQYTIIKDYLLKNSCFGVKLSNKAQKNMNSLKCCQKNKSSCIANMLRNAMETGNASIGWDTVLCSFVYRLALGRSGRAYVEQYQLSEMDAQCAANTR